MTSGSKDDVKSDHAVAGGVSGFVTRLLFQPLDVVKIRFQLQVEPIANHQHSKYKSLWQTFCLIPKEEGLLALWKGHVPAQLLSITYGVTQFYTYHTIMKMGEPSEKLKEVQSLVSYSAGALAGGVATVSSFPFDTVRTRLVAQSSNHMVYKGLLHSFSSMIKTESPKSLYRGLLPTMLQTVPHTGLQFMFYELFTKYYKKSLEEESNSLINSLLSGSAAGLLAKTAVYPFDLARKRMQLQGFEHGRKNFGVFFRCSQFSDCIIVTLKHEGVRGLFKGLVPSQVKAIITGAMHFTVYEQTLRLLKYTRNT